MNYTKEGHTLGIWSISLKKQLTSAERLSPNPPFRPLFEIPLASWELHTQEYTMLHSKPPKRNTENLSFKTAMD